VLIVEQGERLCAMSDEALALSRVPSAPLAEVDYDAIYAAVMDSARGRWFLEEFAQRNRTADTSLLLAAIERLEGAIRNDQSQTYHGFRGELLDMAQAIARTRAEVAESRPDAPAPGEPPAPQADSATAGPESAVPDIFATAERIQDIAWTMRERGFDLSTCDQLTALASSILSASSLRDPTDDRTRKLGDVMPYLEQHVRTMLATCANDREPVRPEPAMADLAADSALPNEPPAPAIAEAPPEPESIPQSAAAFELPAETPDVAFEPLDVAPVEAPVEAHAEAQSEAVDAAAAELEPAPIEAPPGSEPDATMPAGPAPDAATAIEIEPPTSRALLATVEMSPPEGFEMSPPAGWSEPAETGDIELFVAAPDFGPAPDPSPSTARRADRAPEPNAKPATEPGDALAALRAMSDEERIALFS
jgi:hypothetical protein